MSDTDPCSATQPDQPAVLIVGDGTHAAKATEVAVRAGWDPVVVAAGDPAAELAAGATGVRSVYVAGDYPDDADAERHADALRHNLGLIRSAAPAFRDLGEHSTVAVAVSSTLAETDDPTWRTWLAEGLDRLAELFAARGVAVRSIVGDSPDTMIRQWAVEVLGYAAPEPIAAPPVDDRDALRRETAMLQAQTAALTNATEAALRQQRALNDSISELESRRDTLAAEADSLTATLCTSRLEHAAVLDDLEQVRVELNEARTAADTARRESEELTASMWAERAASAAAATEAAEERQRLDTARHAWAEARAQHERARAHAALAIEQAAVAAGDQIAEAREQAAGILAAAAADAAELTAQAEANAAEITAAAALAAMRVESDAAAAANSLVGSARSNVAALLSDARALAAQVVSDARTERETQRDRHNAALRTQTELVAAEIEATLNDAHRDITAGGADNSSDLSVAKT